MIPSAGMQPGAAYLLDKAAGSTSRKAAAAVAGSWGYRKFGHAGTLDPDATGLLIVLLGKATRLARFISSREKTYEFGIRLGMTTDTDDTGGMVLERRPVDGVSRESLMEAVRHFTGGFDQKVPSFSAVRVNGRRAYEMARKGEEPDTPVRRVTAENWRLISWDGSDARMSVTVSSGTYVRALARDIGDRLGTGGTAFCIRRTEIGDFDVEEASQAPDSPGSLMDMAGIMRGHSRRVLEAGEVTQVSHGSSIPGDQVGVTALLRPDGSLLAVAEGNGETLRPKCVMVEV